MTATRGNRSDVSKRIRGNTSDEVVTDRHVWIRELCIHACSVARVLMSMLEYTQKRDTPSAEDAFRDDRSAKPPTSPPAAHTRQRLPAISLLIR